MKQNRKYYGPTRSDDDTVTERMRAIRLREENAERTRAAIVAQRESIRRSLRG